MDEIELLDETPAMRKRRIKDAFGKFRMSECMAMKRLVEDRKVRTRSTRQVELGLYPELPCVRDVAASYGIELAPHPVLSEDDLAALHTDEDDLAVGDDPFEESDGGEG